MTPTIVQYQLFNVKDAFHSQPSLFQNLLTEAREGGAEAQYYGLSVEQPRQLNWIRCYKKLPEQKNLQGLMEVCDGESRSWTLEVNDDDLLGAVAAPILEIVHLVVKPSTLTEDVTAVLREVFACGAKKTTYGGIWGYHLEDDRRATCIVGWESAEDHKEFAVSEIFKPLGQRLYSLTQDSDGYHAKFIKA